MENSSFNWQVVAASVIGTSHEKRSQPCQDAHCWRLLPNGVLAAAVADGAGSAALAEVGAKIAVEAVVETICQQQERLPQNDDEWQVFLTASLQVARAQVEAEAAVREVAARDLACTLIAVVATPELIAVAQIGDGAAVAGDSAGNAIALTVPPCWRIHQRNYLFDFAECDRNSAISGTAGKTPALGRFFRRLANASSQNPGRHATWAVFFAFVSVFWRVERRRRCETAVRVIFAIAPRFRTHR